MIRPQNRYMTRRRRTISTMTNSNNETALGEEVLNRGRSVKKITTKKRI